VSAGRLFAGASPERLFRLQGREIETDCMAGTTERGADAAGDRALADSLLASKKDRLEHYYVLEDSVRRLGDLCTTMNADTTPRVVKLTTLQHLTTTVRGRLKDGIGVGDILAQLHPTPAVGGTPRSAALAAIRELEPYPRGWYAGPIGWIERDRAEFAVAIRSAMLSGANACVFAGAGIVPGSVPETEWQETQNKAQAFLKAVWG
jgi:menaquinone-specific isochorismate synthase